MKSKVKTSILSIILIVIAAATFFAVRSYLLNRLKTALHEKLEKLNESDFHVHYDSIYISWQKNLIVVDNLVIGKDSYDTSCVYPEFISASQVRIEGFQLLALIFRKELKLKEVLIERPHFVFREHSRLLLDSASRKKNEFSLVIGRLLLDSIHIEYIDSASCKIKTEVRTSMETNDLTLDLHADRPFEFAMHMIKFDHAIVRLPEQLYTFTIKEILFNFSEKTVRVDTLKFIPHQNKINFGRTAGHDIDRIEGVIPYIKLSGFAYQSQDSLAFQARTVDIQMFLKIFHDKRLPHKKIYKPLPNNMLRKLSFGLRIDSLNVNKSYVEYEEFPDKAETSGSIFFDNIQASVVNISNDPHLTEGQITMKAESDFMGQGNLKIQTIFPWKPDQNCLMEGSLRDFPFSTINSMLKPAANMEIEKGIMDKLDFKFSYNDTRSDGAIELNYHDLKLVSFQDEDKTDKKHKKNHRRNKNDDDQKKNNLKTFIINAFVIRKTMDESIPKDERTGTVLFHRDTTRSIFNFWWKSLFAGLKSALKLDKAEAKKSAKK